MRYLFLAFVLHWPLGAVAGSDAGLQAHQRGGSATTMREWLPRAEAGDANAQYNLGVMYAKGEGVPEDYVRAYACYNIAAAQGFLHQQGTKTAALQPGINTKDCEIPARFVVRMIAVHFFQHLEKIVLQFTFKQFFHERASLFLIGINPWRDFYR